MSNVDQSTRVPSDDALEQMLKHASPRPTPSQSDEAAVRQAVRAEWQDITKKRQSRQRVLHFAIAASVLLGVFSVFSVFRTPAVDALQVATIEKSFGSIYLLGEESELRETRDLLTVFSGQTIVTGSKTGISLAWGNGGSLRVDENTRVEFTAGNSVYLKSGRVYFDSKPSVLLAGATTPAEIDDFVVVTDFGEVAHIGTQFMTGVDNNDLTVSVREGQVAIIKEYGKHTAIAGKEFTFSGGQQPMELSISRHGKSWEWVDRASRSADVDGKTIDAFLTWVCRELGFELEYLGQAEAIAARDTLNGVYDDEPKELLRMAMATTALDYRIDELEGVIYVSD